jgi:hypothetical protein
MRMVSPALSQLLERARVRFGLEVEILDSRLKNLYPEGGTDLSRIIQDSPTVRRTLLDAIAAGRPQRIEGNGLQYRLYPLPTSPSRHATSGLLAVRRGHVDAADAEPWSDLARAIVEADFAAEDTLGEERLRSRRLVGALRFLDFVVDSADESTLAQALVQAAAVWYDVDARVYRQNLNDEFVLHTWLPGVQPDAVSRVLGAQLLGQLAHGLQDDFGRLASAGDFGEAGTGHEAALLPLCSGRRAEWMLALIGTVPPDADPVLRLIGRVAGARFAALSERRTAEARRHYQALLHDTTKAPELVAMRVLHDLVQTTRASSGSLTLTRNGLTRRIASIGASAEDAGSVLPDSVFGRDRFVCTLGLGSADQAVLELRAAQGAEFTSDAAVAMDACSSVLNTWLAGTLSTFDRDTAVMEGVASDTPAFSVRIEEELERAKRFDLRLSLILIDVTGPADAVIHVQDALRRELRGSDVTGTMSGSQVAALLTHTDALGLDNVVRRLKRRLADTAGRLNVSDMKLGQAAFTPEIATADALLSLAVRQAEPVVVH